MKSWFERLRKGSLAAQAAVLASAALALYAVVAPVAASLSGSLGLAAAAVAAGLCLAGTGSALVACRLFRNPKNALRGVLIGMPLRMGVPLLSGLLIQVQGGGLAKAGLLVYLLVFYPVTLFVETALSLPCDDRPPQSDVSKNAVP